MIRLGDIALHVKGHLVGDPDYLVKSIAPFDNAEFNHLTFLVDKKRVSDLEKTDAGAVIVHNGMVVKKSVNLIETDDPYWSYAKASELFYNKSLFCENIHKTAIIDSTAKIEDNISIGPYCVIGKNTIIKKGSKIHSGVVVENDVIVGNDTEIFSRAVIHRDTIIGSNVIIYAGAVIGSDGFGYAQKNGEYTKIYQLGWVEIKDNVEIGANTCIDRGAIGATVIEKGCKLDNLVHIAHNVKLGKNTAMAAQVGVSGSVTFGRNVRVGGQAGFAGHLNVGENSIIGAQAGVTKSVPENIMVSGYPAREHLKSRKIEAILSTLPEWIKRIRTLERSKND